MSSTKIPQPGQSVFYYGKKFKVISCNMGGKCKIKKTELPNKGSVINDVDILKLTTI